MNRLVLKRLFTNWNAHIELASQGEQAIAISRLQPFDLILMDLEMKPLNGIETVKLIQSDKESKNRDCPVIAINAFLSEEFDGNLENANFQGVILKPFEPNELYRKILEQLNPIKNEKAERQ